LAYDRSESAQPLSPNNERQQRPVTLTLFGNRFADNAMGACQFKSVREVIAYADQSGELKPCGETLSISGDEALKSAWRPIPGRPDAARLVLRGD
jgi:hypothetical protein